MTTLAFLKENYIQKIIIFPNLLDMENLTNY